MFAKLDGVTLPVDSGAGWTYRPGTAPHVQQLRMPNKVADRLFASSRPHSSRLEFSWGAQGKTVAIEKLTILGTDSSDDPNYSLVSVADRRWVLPYSSLYIAMNVPRRTGEKRRVSSDLPPTARTLEDDIAFAAYSLNPLTGRAWTTEEAVKEILDRVAGGLAPGWVSRGVLEGSGQFSPIQDLVIEDNHAAALGTILAELGLAIDVFVDRRGRLVLYDRLDDGERDLVGAPPRGITTRVDQRKPLIVGGATWQVQDRRRERPKSYRVLFERLIEMRFDAATGTSTASTASVDPDAPPATLENVLESPEDFTFGGVTFAAGEVVSFTVFLNHLIGKQPAGLPNLTEEIIRKAMPHGALEVYSLEELDPSGLWARRIDAIQNHWRLTWRIPKLWLDRIRTIEARLASIQSFETGFRGLSPVYVDYAIHVTWRSLGTSIADRPNVDEVVRNRYSNAAARNGGSIVGTAATALRRAAHCRLSVLDEELGLFRLEFGTADDYSATAKRIERSAFEPQWVPTDKTWERRIWLQDGHYQAAYELSFIATISLGSPIDKSRYYAIDIDSKTAQAALPKLRAKPLEADGPVFEILVPASEAMARHEWDDGRADRVYELFSAIPKTPGAETLGEPLNLELLNGVALSKAAAKAAQLADHVEGGAMLGFDPKLEPRGSAEAVKISADRSRGMVSIIELPSEPPQLSARALQPRSVQKVTRRLVDPKN